MKFRQNDPVAVAAARAGLSAANGYRIGLLTRCSRHTSKLRAGGGRPDPLAAIFEAEIVPILAASPGLAAPSPSSRRCSVAIRTSMLACGRTIERRIRAWRALHGPEQEVIFRQTHEPGRMGLSDIHRHGRSHRARRRCAARPSPLSFPPALVGASSMPTSFWAARASWRSPPACRTRSGRWAAARARHRSDSLSAAFRNLDADAQADLTRRYEAPVRPLRRLPPVRAAWLGSGVLSESGLVTAIVCVSVHDRANGHYQASAASVLA